MSVNSEGIRGLPIEIFDRILSYLSYGELVTLGKTCSFFRHLLHDSNYHWRNVKEIVLFHDLDPVDILECINRCSGLNQVDLIGRYLTTAHSQIILALGKCSRLNCLRFFRPTLDINILLEMSLLIPKLKSLELEYVHLIGDVKSENIEGGFTGLNSLSVKNPSCRLSDITALTGKSRNLKYMDLIHIPGFRTEIDEFFGSFPNLVSLQVLNGDLRELKIGDNFPQLERLVLDYITNIDYNGVKDIANKCKNLKSLAIIKSNIFELMKKDGELFFSFELTFDSCSEEEEEGPESEDSDYQQYLFRVLDDEDYPLF